jgi:hypothetical protein
MPEDCIIFCSSFDERGWRLKFALSACFVDGVVETPLTLCHWTFFSLSQA